MTRLIVAILAALFLWNAPALAAIAPVQHGGSQNGGASTTQATTLTGTVAGNFIAVGIFWCDNSSCNGNSGSVSTVVASAGETCLQSPNSAAASGTGLLTDIWYCTNIHGGSDTITVTMNNGAGTVNFLAVLLSEWSGAETTSPLDSVGNHAGGVGGSLSVSTSSSTAVSGELIFSIAGAFNPLSSGQTALNTSISTVVDAYQIAGASAVYTNSYTQAGGDYAVSIAAFKPAGGGGGGAPTFRTLTGAGK